MVVHMHSKLNKAFGTLGAGLLLLAGSCSGNSAALRFDAPAEEPGRASLPSAGELAQALDARGASAVPHELTQFGREYDALLASANVAENILALDMGAQGSSPNPAIADCAYAIWNFNAPQYTEDLKLSAVFNFGFEPQAGSFYVGVVNWDEGRWDWKRADSGVASFGSPQPYKRDGMGDGTVLAALMLIDGSAQVSQLRLGETAHPRVLLESNADSPNILTGSSVTFFAGVFGGEAELFEWDWDGDGIYDEESTFDAAPHAFLQPGTYDVTVRATVAGGEMDTDTLEFTVANPQF
jgi:hypothetical protein